jgi:putative flippase GtrA
MASMGRFGIVGIGSCATYILVALAGEWAGLDLQEANLFGVLASTVFSFLGHVFFSFRKGGIAGAYLWRFLVLSLAVYGLTYLGTHVGVAVLGWPRKLIVLLVAAAIPAFTWTAGRFWVFR